jgi:tetratricopeptide (TPR) repeat protein
MARIDRLSPQDRCVLQTASVIGPAFQKSVLAHVLNAEMLAPRLEESLVELCRREFVGLQTGEEYVFKHSLTLEVTYNSLLIAHRKVLHGRVGEAIEAQFPDRMEELAATVAYHFEQAGNHDKALTYWVRAANFAARLYAVQEAIRCYRRALDVADRANMPASRLICAHEGLGDAHYMTADYGLALQHYEQALQQAADSRQRMILNRKMGQVCEKCGKYDRAVACFKAGVKEMRELIDLEEAAHIYAGLGLAYYRRGELDAALEVCTLALDLAEQEGDEWGIVQACNSLGIVYGGRDEWAQAIAFQLRCMSIREKLGEPFGLAASHNNLGLIYGRQGDAEQAIHHFQESLRLFEKIGNRHGLARVHDNLSQVYMNRGEKDRAMECLMKAVAILAEIGVDGAHIIPEMWQSGAW